MLERERHIGDDISNNSQDRMAQDKPRSYKDNSPVYGGLFKFFAWDVVKKNKGCQNRHVFIHDFFPWGYEGLFGMIPHFLRNGGSFTLCQGFLQFCLFVRSQ